MRDVLVIGANGWLGGILSRRLEGRVSGVTTDPLSTEFPGVMRHFYDRALGAVGKPNLLVINATERPSLADGEVDEVAATHIYDVNVRSAQRVAEVCYSMNGTPLTHLGSASIFDGRGKMLMGRELAGLENQKITEADPPHAVNWYDQTKALGDKLVAIFDNASVLRIRLPIDVEPHPRNALTKALTGVRVVDAPNSVTMVPDLVQCIRDMRAALSAEQVERTRAFPCSGIYHVVAPDPVNLFTVVNTGERIVERVVPGRPACVVTNTRLKPFPEAGPQIAAILASWGAAPRA